MDEAKASKVLAVVLEQYPALRIDAFKLRKMVQELLPQSFGAEILWIVDEDGSYALTDGFMVARFSGESLIWRTPRISFDGIEFDSLIDFRLHGRVWLVSSSYSPDSPFVIDFKTGELLEGKPVDF